MSGRRSLEDKIRALGGEMVECGRRCGRAAVAEAGAAQVQLSVRPSRKAPPTEHKPKWGAILEEAKRKPTSLPPEKTHSAPRQDRLQQSTPSLDLILKDFKHKLRHLDDDQLAHVAFELDKSVARVSGDAVTKTKKPPSRSKCSCAYSECVTPPTKLPPKQPKMVPLEDFLKVQETLESGLSGFEEKFKCLESARTRLKDENIRLLRELNEKTKKLEAAAIRETELQSALTDSDVKVKSLSLKLDQFTLSMQEMSSLLSKVKEDNKRVYVLKEENDRLNNCVATEKEEREKLLSEHQTLLIEREKDKAMLEIKEKEITSLKNNIQSITELIANNLLSQTSKSEDIVLDDSELNFSSSTAKSNDDNSPVISLASRKAPNPNASWRRLSEIPPLSAGGDSPEKRKVRRKRMEKKKTGEKDVEKKDRKEPSMDRLKREVKEIFAAMKEEVNTGIDGAALPNSLLTDDGSFNLSGLSSWSAGTLLSNGSSPSTPISEEEQVA